MTSEFPTALAALVTPFDAAGNIDFDAHRHNVSHLAQRGLRGVLIAGSTGEGPYIEPGERTRLVEEARTAEGDMFILGGIAAETVRTATAQLDEFADAGAHALLVLTPTAMARGDIDAVIRFYSALADRTPLPLLLYSVPKWTAYELPEAAIHELAAHDAIVGMKDSGGDIRRIARMIAGLPDDFKVFNGSSAVLGQAVWSGAYGGITASANYAPELVRRVVDGGRIEDQRRLAAFAASVEWGGIPSVKAAATAVGMRAGSPRAPLSQIGPDAMTRIEAAVARFAAQSG